MTYDPQEHITITLGDEYDASLMDALRVVLLRYGAEEMETSWGVGGSQEVSTVTVQVGHTVILVVAETYMGLSLTGPRAIVEQVAEQVRQHMSG
jgi:hypothetical protein